jgi:hypothetical protein
MPAPARAPLSRPPGAPAYYLARPATLSGGYHPTGSIEFKLYPAPGCTGTPAAAETVTGNGTYTTPAGTAPAQAGSNSWTATHTGNAVNTPAATARHNRPGKATTNGWCEMRATRQPAVTQPSVPDAWCEALFASALQPSHAPTPGMVAEAITCTVRRLGIGGCAGLMAQEFGDHPDAAAERMRWVRQLAACAAARPRAA